MANVLKRERQIEVLSLLGEGCSIRSIERHTGVHRDTVMRLLVRFGAAVDGYLDHAFRSVFVEYVQCDEIWTFVATTGEAMRKAGRPVRRRLKPSVTRWYLSSRVPRRVAEG